MDKYEKQATAFLEITGTTMESQYKGFQKHFLDDTSFRDVWTITLKRSGKTYGFTFGQSINGSKSLTGGEPEAPTAYEVLACLCKDDPGSDMWEWANDYGYAPVKSNKEYEILRKTYESVSNEYHNVIRLFGDSMDLLREIN